MFVSIRSLKEKTCFVEFGRVSVLKDISRSSSSAVHVFGCMNFLFMKHEVCWISKL